MNSTHTPGPWVRDRSSGSNCDVRGANNRNVAACWGLSTGHGARKNSAAYRAECDANAVLISAAPELLDAGKMVILADQLPEDDPGFDEAMERALSALMAAVMKGMGASSDPQSIDKYLNRIQPTSKATK